MCGKKKKLPSDDKAIWYRHESPIEEAAERGVDRSIHHDHAGLTQQKMECWERPLSCEGPGTPNNIFWRLSGCPIKEADI